MPLDDKLDAMTEAVYDIQNAVDELEGVSECEGFITALNGMIQEMGAIRAKLEERQREQDAREQAAMTREYWRSVM